MQDRPYKLDWINITVWGVAVIVGLAFWYKVLGPILDFVQ